MPEFYRAAQVHQQFPRVKVLRKEGANNFVHIARTLLQDHEVPDDDGLAFLPALEENKDWRELFVDLTRDSVDPRW